MRITNKNNVQHIKNEMLLLEMQIPKKIWSKSVETNNTPH